jgi:uncharacterized membrane protein
MRNGEGGNGPLTAAAARTLEYGIIGLGVLALLLIFQPLSISLFTVGCVLIVLAGLVNNLLPLTQPGVAKRSLVMAAMVIAMIFCSVVLVAIVVAHLYGAFFLRQPDPNTMLGRAQLNATPWYMHSFTWAVAGIATLLAGLITLQSRGKQ